MSLYAALTIPYQLAERPAFDLIMQAWQASAPGLLPTHADSIEPVHRPFDLTNPDNAARSWGHGIWIGRRSNPKLYMNIVTGTFFHAGLSVRIENVSRTVTEDLSALIASLALATRPHYGMIHSLTDVEVAEAREVRRPDLLTINRITGRSTLGVGYTRQLQGGIPSIYWQNLFGAPYVELFGRARLLAAPVAIVREDEWGICLQVTDEAPGENTWQDFRDSRDRLMDYLGRDVFWPRGERIPHAIREFEPPPLVATD